MQPTIIVTNKHLTKKKKKLLSYSKTEDTAITATSRSRNINPLNAELNPICHLLALLGDLTFMGPCIVSIFQYTCIYNKMQRYTVDL
jgi:hypothetical protein